MNNKKLILIVLGLVLAMGINAKKTMYPVKWSDIKGWVNHNPAHVRELVNKLGAEHDDTTITREDEVLAFYGQSYLNHSGEDYFVLMMKDSLKHNKPQAALKLANDVLRINILNIDALTAKIEVYKMAADSLTKDMPSNWEQAVAENRRQRLFKVIAATGDGSKKHPFAVTKLSDEYSFVKYYLGIDKIVGQSSDGNYDVINLGGHSGYYKKPVIYFDASRIIELEKEMLNATVEE